MDDQSYMHGVMPIIRWIDDRQEGRQRPVVLISLDSAMDAHGEPRSSMQKAFRRLIENYDVHVVAPADFNDRGAMAETMEWAFKHLDAPSYNHVTFANHPDLLLGDYLISTTPCDHFMGTVIPFGNDTFKTWEEVITYFDRLGGQ